jgi:myo-inositol-1(or 4)-monophosphatase
MIYKKESNALLKEVKSIARQAGTKLLKKQKRLKDLTVSIKEAQGVVSEADIEAEKFIIKKLKKIFPSADFLAEETAFEEHGGKDNAYMAYKEKEWVWIIDPLDGTHNYLNGLDYYAVCIALSFKGRPVLGVIYRPSSDTFYYALEGKGAFIQIGEKSSKKIKPAPNRKPLKSSLLVTGFATEKGEVFDKEFDYFRQMMEHCRGIRRMGSAALDLCLVAEGIFDGFWERGLAPWDMAASSLICLEAGVKVTDYQQEKFHPFKKTILACRTPLFKDFATLFQE